MREYAAFPLARPPQGRRIGNPEGPGGDLILVCRGPHRPTSILIVAILGRFPPPGSLTQLDGEPPQEQSRYGSQGEHLQSDFSEADVSLADAIDLLTMIQKDGGSVCQLQSPQWASQAVGRCQLEEIGGLESQDKAQTTRAPEAGVANSEEMLLGSPRFGRLAEFRRGPGYGWPLPQRRARAAPPTNHHPASQKDAPSLSC